MTGHLVLATLHANSALAAVPRLTDMGVEPYLLASVLRGVMAQRLARGRCRTCLGNDSTCMTCHGTGFAGRLAIAELALLDEELVSALTRSQILPPLLDLRLQSRGYAPLVEDARGRIELGDIGADELAFAS
jgi:type II secretory ATPase GspE/PulE/Tfp pilus assembly ATPase PilB-like protein